MKNCPEVWKGSNESLYEAEIHQEQQDKPKIHQDVKIAIAKAVRDSGGNGSVNVTVNMNANANTVNISSRQIGSPIHDPNIAPMEQTQLLKLIESFPQPRYKNFLDYIFFLAIRHCGGNKSEASRWLGSQWRTLMHRTAKWS